MTKLSKYRVDIFDITGQHSKISFEDFNTAKGHAEGVKKDMPDSNVYILESVAGLKYDVLGKIEEVNFILDNAIVQYNNIMMEICAEHRTIGTEYSENTKNWNLRDMVAESDYWLSCYFEEGNSRCDARFEGKAAFKTWEHETEILKSFINTYKPYIEDLVCVKGHCSKYDNYIDGTKALSIEQKITNASDRINKTQPSENKELSR